MYDNYTSNGVGSLACDQGQDLVYPEGAPGFVYDPTGYLLTLPGRQVLMPTGSIMLVVTDLQYDTICRPIVLTCASCLMQGKAYCVAQQKCSTRSQLVHAKCKHLSYQRTCRSSCMSCMCKHVSYTICAYTLRYICMHVYLGMHHCRVCYRSLSSSATICAHDWGTDAR